MTPHHRPKVPPRRTVSPAPALPLPATLVIVPLAALLLLRAVLAFTPGTWVWGLDLQRFLAPVTGWILWGLMAVTLIPRVSEGLARSASPVGGALLSSRPWAALAAAALAAGLVLLLPDRAWFLGDFQLRQGLIRQGLFQAWLPQSLPLDSLLHYQLPRLLERHMGLSLPLYARAVGALEAALLAALAVSFTRLVNPGPAAAPWLAALLPLGGYVAVFTGYPKSTADQCLLTMWVALLGVQLVRGARVHLRFGMALAIALLDHRLALVLLPAAAYVGWRCAIRRDRLGALALAALPPLVTLAILAPQLQRILSEYDLPMHVRPAEAVGATAWGMIAAFASRMFELLNALVILVPAVILLPWWQPWTRRLLQGRAEAVYLAILILGFLPVALTLQPRQGFFRDWDDVAPLGLALSLWIVWVLSELVRTKRAVPGLAVAVACSVIVPSLGVLLLHHAPETCLARARAFAAGPPQRTVVERTFLWDYVGERDFALGRWRDAAAATEKVAEVEPTRGTLLSWGLAAAHAGDFASARRAFARMVKQRPEDLAAWVGLGGAAVRLGDTLTAADARERLARAPQAGPVRQALVQLLRDHPYLWPALADSLGR